MIVGALFLHIIWLGSDIIYASETLTELESNLVAYQRCLKMCEIPQEAPDNIDGVVNADWPSSGEIAFSNLSLRYRPDTDLVLHNLTFSIKNNEKIGVIGRTGAGKSTLCLALCRIVEAATGSIYIDGQDISKVGLEQLRSKVTIIPQDPTLFTGSLRFNLDPEGIHSDSELTQLIREAALEKLLIRDNKGLDQQVEEGGQNLSSGEKQLLCICRAVLKHNRVVLMDEATANIDVKTEETIQKLILERFSKSTVITIAHRLNTIMHSDKVLVLDTGKVAEYDTSDALLDRPDSIFKSYVESFKNN